MFLAYCFWFFYVVALLFLAGVYVVRFVFYFALFITFCHCVHYICLVLAVFCVVSTWFCRFLCWCLCNWNCFICTFSLFVTVFSIFAYYLMVRVWCHCLWYCSFCELLVLYWCTWSAFCVACCWRLLWLAWVDCARDCRMSGVVYCWRVFSMASKIGLGKMFWLSLRWLLAVNSTWM